jgi:putative hydrolase of the HAD superfamily
MVNWSKLNTVFLDMDGTLLDLHYDNHFWLEHLPKRYAEHFQVTPAQARDKIIPLITAARGQLKWYCTDHWSELLRLNVAMLKAETRDRIAYRPHVTDFLKAVRAKGLNCVIVTNCHPDPLALKLEVTGLDRHVDAIVSSHQLGKPKEDPAFWRDLQQHAPFDPRTTLLVDDSIPVLESAIAAGISQCLAILAPDSQKPPETAHPLIPSIAHFDELLPL